jgi:tRNA(fMet)-specific endonuclease VapC
MNTPNRLYVLDTDTVSLIQRGREVVGRRIQRTPPEQIAVTVITVTEQMRGWLADIHRAKEGTPALIHAYQRFQSTIDY